ncbi:P-loop containing nucleoside triphosphate hydrolase protein [Hysterangium stoloniferum]|nr:P-loop containing nucleoside triphosphate hydrolase protein [Hysterangium stoloniferum]
MSTAKRSPFLSWRKSANVDEGTASTDDEKHDTNDDVTITVPEQKVEKEDAVSLLQLFRFSTKLEICVNFIGLIFAAGAGASQPLMSLLFGDLTNSFVQFGTILSQGLTPSDPEFIAAANNFRTVAAADAAKLTYIGLAMFIATYMYMMIWVHTGEAMAKRVREKYLKAILRQDIAFFDNVGAGEVATRIQTDTHLVQQGTSEKVALVVSFFSSFVTGFILAYIKSWRLALAVSSIVPCIAITGGIMNKTISAYVRLSRTAVAEGGTLAEEVISTVRTAQAFGTQEKLANLYDVYAKKAFTVDQKIAIGHGVGLGTFFFIIYTAYALAFSFGATLILRNETTTGAVITVFLSILIGSFALALVAPEMQAVSHACGAAAKLWATIDRVPTIDSASSEGLKLDHVDGLIELDHVKFNYPSRPNVPIVKDLSIKFEAGKKAALVGASGSGKSTIVSLVERFYDPLSGAVKLDGIDLKALNVKWLRSQIGLVSQEPTLFATTIAENVAHGLIGTEWEHAGIEERTKLIKEACIKANADGFVTKLPNGYNTMVGERGFLLSGGQKQRIAIARAIVSDPRILLLDEATSALDTQSEGVVQDALDKAAAGRTTITIAHRLSTIKDADMIYVMGEGLVLEKGTHDKLLSNPEGPYAKLVQAQKLRETKEKKGQDEDTSGSDGDEKDIQREVEEEVPLGRKETGSRSLASEILDQKKKQGGNTGEEQERQLSLYSLFIRIGRINRETWWKYGLGACFATMTGMIYPAFGIAYGGAIATFQKTGHELRVGMDRNALWFFIIAILSAITVSCQNYLFASAASHLTFKLRSLSFRAILRQDIAFFDEETNSTGSLTSSLSDNPEKVNGLAGITLGAIVQSLACLIGGSIIGLAYNWKIALVGIACIPLVISTGYIRLRVVVLKDQVNKKSHAASAQLACEAAGAIRTVASLTREDDCLNLYSESLVIPLRESNRTAVWSNMLYAMSQAISFFVISLVFWFGSRLVANLEVDTKKFFICLMSTIFGSIQAGNVFSFVPDMSSAQGAANDIINLLDSVPEIDAESPDGKIPQNVQGHIRVEDVHFRYPTRPGVRVLRHLNIEVKPGTYIALVGASGCGKSTVIQLIERFYDPLAGRVYLDDQLISDLNVQEYRKHISLVSQEPTLYAGSIRFNILLGAIKPASEVTQDEIDAACRDANILDFIQSLPDGFDTEVGGKGSQLSGGQKQRIAIARALLRNPKVLLLDEATSALDSNSEKVVQAALDQAAKGRTTIAIAHRLSTIQNADRIYFIKEGQVSESGTHDQLIAQRGGYYEYVQLQALSKK